MLQMNYRDMTCVTIAEGERYRAAQIGASDMHNSVPFNHDLDTVRRRYGWLAPIYLFFELVFLLPHGTRSRAVERVGLTAGDKVLEIGCVTGRNLCHLVATVGAKGRIYGIDYSETML
jgi:SAM-dependent methyltransferase